MQIFFFNNFIHQRDLLQNLIFIKIIISIGDEDIFCIQIYPGPRNESNEVIPAIAHIGFQIM